MLRETANKKSLVPLIVLINCVILFILIPSVIISYGYMPTDDALRHCAKIISQKPWNEILVMRKEISFDPHIGWHNLLTFFYKITKSDIDGLLVFSIIFLFTIFVFVPLFFLERHESWLITLLIGFLGERELLHRLLLGRPYIFTMAIIMAILFMWTKYEEKENIPKSTFIITIILTALSTYIHGLWYLFLFFLITSFLLAGKWKITIKIATSLILGVILGAILTTKPIYFLHQRILLSSYSIRAEFSRMLVTEFQPSIGNTLVVVITAFLIIWNVLQKTWSIKKVRNPIFIFAIIGWILGFKAVRFWIDFGIVGFLVWTAKEFDEILKQSINLFSLKRVLLAITFTITIFFMTTSDINSRWSSALFRKRLNKDNPNYSNWMPEPGGIVYSSDMVIFYDTFYENPTADWRYILGFEPALMPEEDLKIYRNIQYNFGAPQSYTPWIKKMKPQDRLIIRSNTDPKVYLKELEWIKATENIFIGKLPKDKPKDNQTNTN